MRQIGTPRTRMRMIDFGVASIAAGAMWALGLAEVAWMPFVCLAMTPERGAGRCS